MATEDIAFARVVKDELANTEYTTSELKYILSGFIRNGASLTLSQVPVLRLKTEIASVAKLLYNGLKDCYDLVPRIAYEKITRFKKGTSYQVVVADSRIYEMLEDLEIVKDGYERLPIRNGVKSKNFKFLLIGSFLAGGSINNPSSTKTSYFAEIAFTDKNDAFAVKKKLCSFKEERTMGFKYIKRREKHVIYLKKSDQISVFLSYIGATEAMFAFENARILKDDINVSNRLSICDSANYGRTLETAQKDINTINHILQYVPLSSFDEKTQAVIKKRLELEDANYRELAEEVTDAGYPISKSGVVHIIQNLRDKEAELSLKEKNETE